MNGRRMIVSRWRNVTMCCCLWCVISRAFFMCPGRAEPVLGLTYSAVGKSGVLVMESDEIVQHWHIIIIMIHKT